MKIETIVQMAKEQLLEHKEHAPTFYIETAENVDVLVLDSLPETTFAKQKLFFSIARRTAKEHKEQLPVQQIVFVCEAWMSTHKVGESWKYASPSQDPNRTEMLTIQVLDCMPDLRASLYRVEMLRDGSGDLVDLLTMREELECVKNRLLESFLAGYVSANLSDEEFFSLLTKYSG